MIAYGPEKGPKFCPMLHDDPILVQVSPKRYVVVFLSWPITGGACGASRQVKFRKGEIRFGPASYDACMDWIRDPSPTERTGRVGENR